MSQFVYTLTSLTGRKRNVGRTIIINGFEFGRRALIIVAISVGASLIPALVLSSLFGPLLFILTPGVFVAAAFILFESRSRQGLQVRLYQSILDKKKANTNEFYICFRPVSETLGSSNIVRSSVDVVHSDFDAEAATAVFTAPHKKNIRANSIASLLESKS
jgi:hypothetical protein